MSTPTASAIPPRVKNLVGQTFGRLTVTGYSGKGPYSYHYWECQCSCGQSLKKLSRELGSGDAKSCGCLKREKTSELGKSARTHGMKDTPEWRVWSSMKSRTTNPNDSHWPNYGGRGIKVCDQWANSFENFYRDMGPKPSPDHSLDRFPDMNGNYEPANCRWATDSQQARNRRSNRPLTCDGETLLMVEWSERMGHGKDVIIQRLRRGWSVCDAIKTPSK